MMKSCLTDRAEVGPVEGTKNDKKPVRGAGMLAAGVLGAGVPRGTMRL